MNMRAWVERASTERHCPSAKSVSKASEDLPEPDTPVTTVTRSWGMSSEMFFRLFCLAPSIRSQEGWAIREGPPEVASVLHVARNGQREGGERRSASLTVRFAAASLGPR